MESLILRNEDASAHDRVEAAQGGNQQMQPVGADRRLIRRLDEPAFNATRLQRTPGLEQEQPRVLAHRLRSSVPGVAMLGQEAEPGSFSSTVSALTVGYVISPFWNSITETRVRKRSK